MPQIAVCMNLAGSLSWVFMAVFIAKALLFGAPDFWKLPDIPETDTGIYFSQCTQVLRKYQALFGCFAGLAGGLNYP